MKLVLPIKSLAVWFAPWLFLVGLNGHAGAVPCSDATAIGQELRDPPTFTATNFMIKSGLKATLADKCINGKIVSLKSYQDARLPVDARPVGPAYVFHVNEIAPNPTFTLNFENDLGSCKDAAGTIIPCNCDHNSPDVGKCTNLHTHGLHVSPAGNSDNVLLAFKPGDKFQYQFNIANTHPQGTHWMHAHLHGSTAPQLREGMSGALILKGRTDRWLANQGIREKIMILQQLSTDGGTTSLCAAIPTSINGQCHPKITAKAGDILRLRLIHAGISASIFFGIKDNNGIAQRLHEFARDGINMGKMTPQQIVELQPGYRSDVLFQVPVCAGPGMCKLTVVDNASPASMSLLGEAEDTHTFATILVQPNRTAMRMPSANDPHFAKPYPEIQDSELVAKEEKNYFASIPPGAPGNPGTSTIHTVNGDIYPAGNSINLTVGQAQTWRVWVGESQTSAPGPSHPYHIHVNPFEVIKRDEQGKIKERYWKDTYLISSTTNKGEKNAVELRARYETFIGDFVMHCHNLFHEDAGMMKLVRMNPPTASSHDHK